MNNERLKYIEVNKDWLKEQIESGNVVKRCNLDYGDISMLFGILVYYNNGISGYKLHFDVESD